MRVARPHAAIIGDMVSPCSKSFARAISKERGGTRTAEQLPINSPMIGLGRAGKCFQRVPRRQRPTTGSASVSTKLRQSGPWLDYQGYRVRWPCPPCVSVFCSVLAVSPCWPRFSGSGFSGRSPGLAWGSEPVPFWRPVRGRDWRMILCHGGSLRSEQSRPHVGLGCAAVPIVPRPGR